MISRANFRHVKILLRDFLIEEYSPHEFIRLHQYLRIGYTLNEQRSERRNKVVSASCGRYHYFATIWPL